jgi:hypothetical protein
MARSVLIVLLCALLLLIELTAFYTAAHWDE